MQYQTKIIEELDGAFIEAWKELWNKAEHANIYNSYEWFNTCLKTYAIKNYEIHACYKDGKLVALLPLQQYRCFGISVYGTICREQLVDTSFLMETYEKTTFKYLFGSILEKHKNIYFQKFDSEATEILHKLFPQFFIVLMSVNPFILTHDANFEEISQSNARKIKKIIKRNEGKLHFETYDTNLPKHLETMFTIQQSSSKKMRSMDIFENVQTKEYYKNLVKICKEFVRISILSYEGKPIGYEFGLQYKDHYAGEQISYHNDYKYLSPGKLLIYYLVEDLKKEGITNIDQGGGINAYKMLFAKNYRILYNVYYSNNIFIMLWWKGINKARRIKQVLLPKENTQDHLFLFKTL